MLENIHIDRLLKKLENMRLEEKETTLTIEAIGGRVVLHPLMLAASSPAFRVMVKQATDTKKTASIILNQKIEDVSAALDFMYTAKLNVVAEHKGATVQGVTEVAKELGLDTLLHSAALRDPPAHEVSKPFPLLVTPPPIPLQNMSRASGQGSASSTNASENTSCINPFVGLSHEDVAAGWSSRQINQPVDEITAENPHQEEEEVYSEYTLDSHSSRLSSRDGFSIGDVHSPFTGELNTDDEEDIIISMIDHHSIKGRFSCTRCNVFNLQDPSFGSYDECFDHAEKHFKEYNCLMCGATQQSKDAMQLHFEAKHVQCNMCGRFFHKKKDVKSHILTSSRCSAQLRL